MRSVKKRSGKTGAGAHSSSLSKTGRISDRARIRSAQGFDQQRRELSYKRNSESAVVLYSEFGRFIIKAEAVDSIPNEDVSKRIGVSIHISFEPTDPLVSDKLCFVQVMKCRKTAVYLDEPDFMFEPNVAERATEDGDGSPEDDGGAGWALDRRRDRRSPIYGENNDGKAATNTVFGFRQQDGHHKNAVLKDLVEQHRHPTETIVVQAETYALAADTGSYVGGVKWGCVCNTMGQVSLVPVEICMDPFPTGAQAVALRRWNEQADLGDDKRKNHPDQIKVPLP